jgi:Protein of unknown function DUF86
VDRTRGSFALSQRRDVDRLADMRAALADIRDLTQRDKETFRADRVAQQAVAYNLAVLGEAARALSPELRDAIPTCRGATSSPNATSLFTNTTALTSKVSGPRRERTSRSLPSSSARSRQQNEQALTTNPQVDAQSRRRSFGAKSRPGGDGPVAPGSPAADRDGGDDGAEPRTRPRRGKLCGSRA